MELLGLLIILAAIAEKIGQAIGWCFITLCRGLGLLIVAICRLILSAKNDRVEASRQEKSNPAGTTNGNDIEDAIAGLKQLGVPMGAAKRVVEQVAKVLGPDATAEQLIKGSLRSMDQR